MKPPQWQNVFNELFSLDTIKLSKKKLKVYHILLPPSADLQSTKKTVSELMADPVGKYTI